MTKDMLELYRCHIKYFILLYVNSKLKISRKIFPLPACGTHLDIVPMHKVKGVKMGRFITLLSKYSIFIN